MPCSGRTTYRIASAVAIRAPATPTAAQAASHQTADGLTTVAISSAANAGPTAAARKYRRSRRPAGRGVVRRD